MDYIDIAVLVAEIEAQDEYDQEVCEYMWD